MGKDLSWFTDFSPYINVQHMNAIPDTCIWSSSHIYVDSSSHIYLHAWGLPHPMRMINVPVVVIRGVLATYKMIFLIIYYLR